MQLLETRRSSRRPRWRKWVVPGVLAAAGLGAWLAWDPAVLRYKQWKQQRALAQAREFIAKRDAPNAQLALDVALKAVPGNPDTIRVAADMLESVGAPQAMRLRRAVVQVVPDSAEDLAKLVLSCLRFRDFNAAKDALSGAPAKVAAEVPALRAALAYALSTDDKPVADYLLNRLRADFPDDVDLRRAHALLRLRHPRDDDRAAAKRELEAIARDHPKYAMQINRELAGQALQLKDYSEAKSRLAAVIASPEATLSDRLQRANVELLVDKMPFEPLFSAIAPFAGKSEADIGQLVQWLLVQNRAGEADRWLGTLPAEVRTAQTVRAIDAEVVAQLGDWDRLAELLLNGAWGPVPKETIRLAIAAHTVSSPSKPSLRRDTWDMALSSASGSLLTLRTLQRLAGIWQWSEESERTLWTIARAFPDQTWAHQALFNLYREKKNTAGMREVMGSLRDSDGTVPRYQHDWALLTMTTEPTSNWNPAKDTMRQLYIGEPTNATYATGYAFALAQAGRGPEALAVVEKLSAEERAYPPRQPFLAFVYGVNRKPDDLARAVSLSEGGNFLPEESYLFTRAREELNRKPEKTKASKPSGDGAETSRP